MTTVGLTFPETKPEKTKNTVPEKPDKKADDNK